jgi:enoyl-CoA hydratase/carnithine racemase
MAKASLEISGAVGVLTLNNPPLNLIDFELIDEIESAVEEATEASIRALLLRAEGTNFSGGANVKIFENRSAAGGRRDFASALPVIAKLEDLPFPTLAAVQGLCLAGGLELVLACDMIFVGESARMGHTEAQIGTSTLLGGAQRIAERAGAARAREMIYTAGIYDAATLERWNVVNRVVPDEALTSEAMDFTERMAAGPTRAHAVTKRLIRAYLDGGTRAADRTILDLAPPLFETEDMKGGVATLLEHGARELARRAHFEGR